MSILHDLLQRVLPRLPLTREGTTAKVSPLPHCTRDLKALNALLQKRQIIEVSHHGDYYHSLILGVDTTSNLLILDDLFPTPDGQPIIPGDQLTISHRQHSRVLTFKSEVLTIDCSQSSPLYVVQLPRRVEYRQRRSTPRLSLNGQRPLTVKLTSPLHTPWFATAENLSSNGLRLSIAGNYTGQLYPGAVLPSCSLYFNHHFHINCRAVVRSFRFYRRPYRHTQISLQFLDNPLRQQTQLALFIETALQHPAKAA